MQSTPARSRRGASSGRLIIGLSVLGIAITAWFFLAPKTPDAETLVRELRLAIGEMENLESDEAERRFEAILPYFRNDPSLQRNIALNATVRLRTVADTIRDTNLEKEIIEQAKQRFPEVWKKARIATDRFRQVVPDSEIGAWLDARIRIIEADQADSQELRREIVADLRTAMEAYPASKILSDLLLETLGRINDKALNEKLLPILINASEQNPRNLYLGLSVAQHAVVCHDRSAEPVLRRTRELAEPLVNETASVAKTMRMQPLEIVDKALEAIAQDDWERAIQLCFYWINMHKQTAAYKTDTKQAKAHELDLISFDLSRSLSASVALDAQQPETVTQVSFDLAPVNDLVGDVRQAQGIDIDLDGSVEIVALAGQNIVILKKEADQWETFAEVTVPEDSQGLVVADLFLVDARSPDSFQKPLSEEDKNDLSSALRHSIYQSLVVYGGSGVQIFRCNLAATTPAERLLPPAGPTGLESNSDVTALIAGDLDADGDLDLTIATKNDGVGLWINQGSMTFYSVAAHSQLPPVDSPITKFHIVDFDRDLDLDVLTLSEEGQIGILENVLHSQFRWKPLELGPNATSALDFAVAEVDGNVSWDVVSTHKDSLHCNLTETLDIGTIRFDQFPASPVSFGDMELAELNNDPWQEVVCFGESEIEVYQLDAQGSAASIGKLSVEEPIRSVDTQDMNDDGLPDLILTTDKGIQIATNTTAGAGNHLQVHFMGIDDNLSGRVNHYAIGSVLELRFGSYYRAQVITERMTHFPMGSASSALALRAILPNGITQNVIKPDANQLIEEQQTLKGSCPYLYTWDGEKYVFATDCLWAAPLGLQVAPGKVVPDRPWEYLKVSGQHVAARDGYYDFRITEELWELAYIDGVRLFTVDHPTGTDIFTNEKVGPASIAEHHIYCFDDQKTTPVLNARDTYGRDVSAELHSVDQQMVTAFDRQYRQGLCEPHHIELMLPEFTRQSDIKLMLTGWIFPTDTSLNIQIAQNPALASVVHPIVEIPDGSGNWKTVVPFMGFPGGKTKTIVVDLTGKLNPNDHRIRIKTSAQIYWDCARVAIDVPESEIRQQDAPLASANLSYRGFSELIPRDSDQPHRYDYQNVSTQMKWPPLEGKLTRYGNTLDLVQETDDAMIVMAGGDDLHLRFKVPEQPVPDGWTRDFVLYCAGWDKDADLNTLTGQSVEPLPFREMKAYPPPVEQHELSEQIGRNSALRMTRRQSFRGFWPRVDYPQPKPYVSEVGQ